MSELDDLEEIAALGAYGWAERVPNHPIRLGRAPREQCINGHAYTEKNTRWYKDKNRLRRACKACDRARAKRKRQNAYANAHGHREDAPE